MRRFFPIYVRPSDQFEERIGGHPIGFPQALAPFVPPYEELEFVCQLKHDPERFPFGSDGDVLFVFSMGWMPFGIVVHQHQLASGPGEFHLQDGVGHFPGFAISGWSEDDDGIVRNSDEYRWMITDNPPLDLLPEVGAREIFRPVYLGGTPHGGHSSSFYAQNPEDQFLGVVCCIFEEVCFDDVRVFGKLATDSNLIPDGGRGYPTLDVANYSAGFWLSEGKLVVTTSY
jgi:hypothetical protein